MSPYACDWFTFNCASLNQFMVFETIYLMSVQLQLIYPKMHTILWYICLKIERYVHMEQFGERKIITYKYTSHSSNINPWNNIQLIGFFYFNVPPKLSSRNPQIIIVSSHCKWISHKPLGSCVFMLDRWVVCDKLIISHLPPFDGKSYSNSQ